jgi:AcrR family transcriptional regulator
MRVTAEVKARTRQAILETGAALFAEHGYEETSTREIATAAGVATGTLFNYFPNKEALALEIVVGELAQAVDDLRRRRRAPASRAEAMFELIAWQLRRLDGRRDLVAGALPGLIGRPLDVSPDVDAAVALMRDDGEPDDAAVVHLYRAVHAGVLAFWIEDESPGREDTLALLDRLTRSITDPAGAMPQGDWP